MAKTTAQKKVKTRPKPNRARPPRPKSAPRPSTGAAPSRSRPHARAAAEGGPCRVGTGRGQQRGQVRLLHHQDPDAARLRSAGHRRRAGRYAHRQLPRHRRGGLEYADGGPGSDPRQRPRPSAGQRNRHAAAHRDPDVVRHGLQDRRRHHRAAAIGLRRVRRRPEQDAGQVRVRPQGAVGPRSDHPGDRRRGRRHPPSEGRNLLAEGLHLLRPHAVRPADRRGAAGAVRALRRRDLPWPARRVGRVALQQADRRPDDHERRLSGRPARPRPRSTHA